MEPGVKNILILGATGGIGTSIAKALANKETVLYLHGTSETKLKALAEEITPSSAGVTTYIGDLTTEESTRLFCELVTADAGIVFDWIVYCAGYIDESEPQGLISTGSIAKTFNINVLAAAAIIQTSERAISNQGGVLLISSTAGLWGNGDYPMYAASKAALNNLGKSLAKRWGDGKKAITVCPGPTNTAMREKIAHDAHTHQSPEEVARLVHDIIKGDRIVKSGTILQVRNNEVTIIPD